MSLITSSDFKRYAGITDTDTTHDNLILELIGIAQTYVEQETGRLFEVTTDAVPTTRYFTVTEDVVGLQLYLDQELVATSSVVAGTDTIASSNYILLPPNGPPYYAIKIKGISGLSWAVADSDDNYENAIQVSGYFAYSSDAPNDIKLVMYKLVNIMLKQRAGEGQGTTIVTPEGLVVSPAGMPAEVQGILARYKRMIVA
jgi:hypothetical protein